MSELLLDFDGQPVPLQPGDSILSAVQRAGHELPHLCWHPEVSASASCRLCTVLVDGRPVAACVTPASADVMVDVQTLQSYPQGQWTSVEKPSTWLDAQIASGKMLVKAK